MTTEELACELRRRYNEAKINEAAMEIHLFGIEYAGEIKETQCTLSDIVETAGLSRGYSAELSKGVKLSDRVIVKKKGTGIMDKEIFFRIKDYLKTNGIADIDGDTSKMQLRANGKTFTTAEHVQGMIYSMLSAQTVWANIERNFAGIDRLFSGYDIDRIREHDYLYYVNGLKSLGCGSRLTNAQMKALHENLDTVERIIREYGSMDAFLTSRPQREIVEMLSSGGSRYKIKQMGPALAWEYLRNVGIDGAKPDVHMKRILGADRLGVSKREEASDAEVLDAMRDLSAETGFWMAEIDYLFWAYCATGKGQICTADPACDRCVIKEYCNRNTR